MSAMQIWRMKVIALISRLGGIEIDNRRNQTLVDRRAQRDPGWTR